MSIYLRKHLAITKSYTTKVNIPVCLVQSINGEKFQLSRALLFSSSLDAKVNFQFCQLDIHKCHCTRVPSCILTLDILIGAWLWENIYFTTPGVRLLSRPKV